MADPSYAPLRYLFFQFEAPKGVIGSKAPLSEEQLAELVRRSYTNPMAAREQSLKRVELARKSEAEKNKGKAVPTAQLNDMAKRLALPVG